jgi:heptaprenyl diphosphate synthase
MLTSSSLHFFDEHWQVQRVANMSSTRRFTTIAFLSAAGIALFVIESYIPMPLPFLRIGLANISSVIALMLLGPASMHAVVVLRVVVGSFFVASFMSPAFVLALAAGVLSAFAMAITKTISGNVFSALGISLVGSVAHVIVQLLLVRFIYVQNAAVLQLLPLLLLTALAGGVIVGGISVRLLLALKQVRI